MSRGRLPRIVEAILRATLPSDWRDDIIVDLEREYAARRARGFRGLSGPWLAVQVVSFPVQFGLEAVKSAWGRVGLDLRFGVRSVARHPRHTVAAAGILSLGIAAAVTIFSMVEAVLLRPLPYPEPGRLVILETQILSSGELDGSSVPNVEDWAAMAPSIAELTYFRRPTVSQATILGDFPLREQEGLVGPGFFEVVRVPAFAGRTFTEEEAESGTPVAVLRVDLWEELFGVGEFRPGEIVSIGGLSHDVVGVMPLDFELPTRDTRLWRPLSATEWWSAAATIRAADGVMALARLDRDVSLEETRAEMARIADVLRAEYAENEDKGVRVDPLSSYFEVEGSRRSGLWMLLAAVLLLLALACTNVAGLTTARSRWRAREIAVRSAIGAGRPALVGHMFTEGLVLAAIATGMGTMVSYYAVRIASRFGPADLPGFDELTLSPLALGLATAVGASTAVLFALIPALEASSVSPASVLSGGRAASPSAPGRKLGDDLLVAGQVLIATVLLVGGSLLATSYARATAVDPGFERENLAVVSLNLPEAGYPGDEEMLSFHQLARERLEALPQVEAAGGISGFFLEPGTGTDPRTRSTSLVAPEGGAGGGPGGGAPEADGHGVTIGYLDAMRIPLVAGRYLDETDMDLSPLSTDDEGRREAIVISEAMAEAYWPGQDPLGRSIQFGVEAFDPGRFAYQVVGVVRDVLREGLDVSPRPAFYIGDVNARMDLSIRTTIPASAAISTIRSSLAAIDPELPLTVRTAEDVFADRLATRRFETGILLGFAVLALTLSIAGLYAMVSYYVATRTREIGLRGALGAPRSSTVGLIVRRCALPVFMGLAAGLLVAASLAVGLRGMLFEIRPLEPIAYLASAALLLGASIAGAYFPARRATRIQPLVALRTDS